MAEKSKVVRSCDGCTECCFSYEIYELKKLARTWCAHCDTEVGCKIYPERPHDCQWFSCQWRNGYGDLKDRPDKTGVIIDYRDGGYGGDSVTLRETRDGVLKTQQVKKIELKLRRQSSAQSFTVYVAPLAKHNFPE